MKTKVAIICGALLLGMWSLPLRAAEVGVSDAEIRIGQFAAQTGPAAELGKRMQLGIQTHFTAVNAAGTGARAEFLGTGDNTWHTTKPP